MSAIREPHMVRLVVFSYLCAMSLVILGTVAFDAIETPFGKTDKIVGGAATFAGLAASYLYDKVKLLSVIGEDFVPHLPIFEKRKIAVDGVEIKKGEKSFFWSGKYRNDMNARDTLVTDLNVLAAFKPVIPDSYQDCEYILLGNLTPQVQMQALSGLSKKPKLVALDTMNYWMDVALEDLHKVLRSIDVLTINDDEARQLSGEYSLVRAAEAILKMGPSYLVIKKGEHGALLFGEGQIFSAPALPLADVFDPTGAGDSFAGGFMGYLASVGAVNFANMKNAVIVGSALASFCVEKFGTEQLQLLNKDLIQERIERFVSISQFHFQDQI